jgi:hypothetical protein
MIDYLALIRKEFPQTIFSFTSGELKVQFNSNLCYNKSVYKNSKRLKTIDDLNIVFENSYKNIIQLKDSNFIDNLIKKYNLPVTTLHITDAGITAIKQIIKHIDGCIIDENKVQQFKKDIFSAYRSYYDKYIPILENEIYLGRPKIQYKSMFDISLKGLHFYCRKPYSEFYNDENKFRSSLTVPSIYYCTDIFNEIQIDKSKRQIDPFKYQFYEKFFISYLYHINGIDTILSTLEYLSLNLDKKFPDPIYNKQKFSWPL